MLRLKNRALVTSLLALSLGTLAGCAAPMPTGAPAATTTTAIAGAPAATPAEAGAQPAAPSQPAAPAAAAMTFSGTASFRGEPEAGLALKAFDAFSGQELTVGGAASSNGVAVTALSAVSGAKGEFSLTVTGLGEGQAVKLVGTKGSASFSALVSAKGGYKVQQAGDVAIQLDELTTALARLSDGVLRTFGATGAKGSADALDLAAKIDALGAKLVAAFKANPALANGVVAGDDEKAQEASLGQLLDNAGAKDALKDVVGEAVALLGKSDTSSLKPDTIAFTGLDLKLNIKDAKVTLENGAGRTVDAKDGDSVKEATKPQTSGGHGETTEEKLARLLAAYRTADEAAASASDALELALQPALEDLDTAQDALDSATAAAANAQTAYNQAHQAYLDAQAASAACIPDPFMPINCMIFQTNATTAMSTETQKSQDLTAANGVKTAAQTAYDEAQIAYDAAAPAERLAYDNARTKRGEAIEAYLAAGGTKDAIFIK